MQPAVSKLFSLVLVGLLASCSGYRGTWPKLGPTTSETSAIMTATDDLSTSAARAEITALSPEAQSSLEAVTARLAQVAISYQDLDERLTMQMRSVSAAASKVGNRTGSGWSLAQLELSRLGQIETELRAIRSDAAGVAADLAIFSAKGLDVNAPVTRTGTLINAIDTALSEAAAVRQNARNRLSS